MVMGSALLPTVWFRFMLPLSLLAGCLLRYSAFSTCYLVFLMIIPLLPSPSEKKFNAGIKLQSIILVFSSMQILGHIIFQIVLLSYQPYGHFIGTCSSTSNIVEQIGFYRFDNCEIKDVVRLLAPDVSVFAVSLVAVLLCRQITSTSESVSSDRQFAQESTSLFSSHTDKIFPLLSALLLLLAGIIQPNVLCSLYFLSFLVFGICWAFHCFDNIKRAQSFFCVKVLLTVYAGIHLLLLYGYQFPFFQHALNPTCIVSRLLGLPAIINAQTCDGSQDIKFNKLLWPFYVVPFVVFLLYWVLAVESRFNCRKQYVDVVAGRMLAAWWHPKAWSEIFKETSVNQIKQEYEKYRGLTLFKTTKPSFNGRKLHCEAGCEGKARWKLGNFAHKGTRFQPFSKFIQKLVKPLLQGAIVQQYGSVLPEEPAIRMEEIVEPLIVQGTFSSVVIFLMRQSYIAVLIIMMTWSITYHSWLTFVLLLWACLTWITPFARWFCMVSSPYLVVYSTLLLILQYIYGMNLNDHELPVKERQFNFSELGFVKFPVPVFHLLSQTLFSCVFLVNLRQHILEKMMKQKKVTIIASEMVLTTLARPIVQAIKRRVNSGKVDIKAETVYGTDQHDDTPSDDAKELMAWMKSALAKYWILLCCFAFLLVALQNSVSLYQIFYMVIFLMGLLIYQFSLRIWKIVLRPLWWFMVVYSIIILLTIYTYQFDCIHQYWYNGTHLNDQWLHDIGLGQQSKSGLLLELIIPTIFSIVIVIQLHFFYIPLLTKINQLLSYRKCKNGNQLQNNLNEIEQKDTIHSTEQACGQQSTVSSGISSDTKSEMDKEVEMTLLRRMYEIQNDITVVLWRVLEMHSHKITSFIVMLAVLQQVSAINAILVVLLALAMPSERLYHFLKFILIAWSSVIVLVFMFYQLEFVEENILDYNCTKNTNTSYIKPANNSHFVSNAWWLGFHKSAFVSKDVHGYLFIVLFIVFEKVIKHHQEYYRYQKNIQSHPQRGIIFNGVTRKLADENIVDGVKYLCNHFFTLFGFELNLMVMIICMSIRGDGIAVLHSLWAALFLFVEHETAAKLWKFYVPYLCIMIPFQYILILGWPPGWCNGYPWDNFEPATLVQWLFLTDVENPQNQYLLLADFFQFLAACSQANVFKQEAQMNGLSQNVTINNASKSKQDVYVPPDFTVNKTWLDFMKIVLFDQFLWLTLSVVYITAQSATSIFNSGFIVGCFFFLWHGQGLYLRPRHTMKRWWKTLIAYNFFVIMAKVWLQVVSCVFLSYVYQQTDCYLIQLLNLYCLRSDVYSIDPSTEEDCMVDADTGLMMDSLCFVVVIIQYLIFNSTYFKYVIREHRKQSEIAYRGAQLVEEQLLIRLNESIQRDKKKMQMIRTKVAKLKQRLGQLNPKAQEPRSHYEAIYSGDYYLFEDSETESDSDIKDDDMESTEDDSISATIPQQTSEQQQNKTEKEAEQPDPFAVESGRIFEAEQTDGLRRRRQKHCMQGEESAEISLTTTDDTLDQIEDKSEARTTCKEKLQEFLQISGLFFQDLANRSTSFLNETSKDYRYVTSQLTQEKKEQQKEIAPEEPLLLKTGKSCSMTNIDVEMQSSSNDGDTWSAVASEDDIISWKKTDSCGVRLAVSFYYALLANTDLLCYSLMIVNHMYYACVLSMPLPFFVFIWGMLSIPRPTKRFWITVITYVELVIVVKYVFQFQLPEDKHLNFNECAYYDVKEAKSPLCPPRIFGIERNQYSSVCDLLLLLCLFFHRFALKAHGLWRERAWSDEEDISPRTELDNNQVTTACNSDIPIGHESSNISFPESWVSSNISRVPSQHKQSIIRNVKRFIRRMLDPNVGTGAVDVYAWMFGAQFIVFVIILSSWSAFSSNQEMQSNFAKIIEENNVPKTFLYMLLTQFLFIVLDRYLYMRKHVLAKLLYLSILVFLFHIFLFVVVPQITQRSFTKNVPAMFMYLFQCLYFGLSAYQVRCGYPTCILGNFLTKNYTVTSGILFQGIQSIPFLLELRSVLDWVCTRTTLTLSHWLKMEDIYANVFILKCWRDSEKTWPHSRGMPYWSSSKWLIGGILVTMLIAVIWFPLLLMSFINSAYISNRPVEVTFTLTVGGYQPLFKVSTQPQYLTELSTRDINSLIAKIKDWDVKSKYGQNWDFTKIEQGIQDYKKTGNIVRIQVLSNSSAIWTISPPSRDFLIQDLESNSSIAMRFKYVYSRESNTTETTIVQESVSGVTIRPLPPGDPMRQKLAKVLRSPSGDGEISIPNLFPTFMQVPASGSVKPVMWIGNAGYVNSKLILRRGVAPHLNTTQVEWWDIVQEHPKPLFSRKSGYLEIIAFNDMVPPLHLSFFANKGIIGLYVGFVWLVGKFVRLFFTSISYRIMFDELPNVNRVLKLCLEIYMVRESKELKLEEDLFAKLLFLYRSPETLIKWTKYKRLKTS